MNSKIFLALTAILAVGCATSSTTDVKKEAYAKLNSKRMFEYPIDKVNGATSEVAKAYPVLSQKEEKDHSLTIETDWVLGESRDKYVNYKNNEHMRHKNLQSRFKYSIRVAPAMGGAEVSVKATEEVEKLNKDGTPDGFHSVKNSDVDSSRANEFLNRVEIELRK